MDDTNLQETAARLDAKIDALSAEMKAGFQHAFEQTQGGFDATHDFVMFLDERLRKDMSERFSQVERRFDAVDERFERIDQRFDRMDQRFDRMDERFDRLERLIKER